MGDDKFRILGARTYRLQRNIECVVVARKGSTQDTPTHA